MSKIEITIEIDDNRLSSYEDSHLAALWHVAQANPADGFATSGPGELTARIGSEIIRRWLAQVPPELYHHQAQHYYWKELTKLGKWNGNREFVPRCNCVDTEGLTHDHDHHQRPKESGSWEVIEREPGTSLDGA